MANVKISELPNLSTLAYDDVIIVNDTSSGTTCKTTVNALVNTNIVLTVTPVVEGLTFTDGTTTKTVQLYPHTGNLMLIGLNDLNLSNPTGEALQCGWKFTVNSEYGYTSLGFVPTLLRNVATLPNMPNGLPFFAPGYGANEAHIKSHPITNMLQSDVYFLPANSSINLRAERILAFVT